MSKARPLVDGMIARLASELDEVPASATSSAGGAGRDAKGAVVPDSPDANPLQGPAGLSPPNADRPKSDRSNTDQPNVARDPSKRITIDQPAATPRASAPPTAGTLNCSAAPDLPGSVLFQSPGANTGPAADRQLALSVRG